MTNITKKLFIIFFIIISSANPAFSKKNNSIAIGNENAKITIKVFSSLTCPHCANFHNKIYEKLKDEFIDSGKVRFEHYGFPLDFAALNAEKILRCNNNKKITFQLLSEIYKKQDEWAVGSEINTINNSLKKIGLNFGLSEESIDKCINNEVMQDEILEERIDAQKKYKISSTPTIYVNEKKYEGNHEFKNFKKFLEKLL